MNQSILNIINFTLSIFGITGLLFIGYSLAPTKTQTITNTIIKTVTINHLQSKNNKLIEFVKTSKYPTEIPAWVKRLDPENPDTQMMIDSYQMDSAFFTWDNYKPTIGKIQFICDENKECWLDFGYIT